MKPILSILVPTFQRCHHLELLLEELEFQLSSLPQGFAEVVVGDNCSNDDTQQVVARYVARNASWRYIRNEVNVGADRNFISLVHVASGSYFWILGDDDLPRRGLLLGLASVLANEAPSLFFLPPLGCSNVGPLVKPPLHELSTVSYAALDFARKVNHWVTFMSCWIVNSEHLRLIGLPYDYFQGHLGTNLIQLSWSLPLMVNPRSKLIAADDVCIIATTGNSGGYNVLKTFCLNYPDVVRQCFSANASMSRAMIVPYVRSGLPGLIFAVRNGGYCEPGQSRGIVSQSIARYWCYPSFWLLCMPSFIAPLFMLKPFVSIARRLLLLVRSLFP